jgi:hypothetical protein
MCGDVKTSDFSLRLHELRTFAGLSPAELSVRTGISRSTLYRYESSQSLPDSKAIIRLAMALHTSTDYLLGLDDIPTLKFYHLSPEQTAALCNFIEQFVERKD